jgi:regulation of enolase protein 1 (concanavalin A-like superfamily)
LNKLRLNSLGSNPTGWADLGLCWMNEAREWSLIEGQPLVLTASPLADFFNDPHLDSVVATAPFLYTLVQGNFVATIQLSVDMIAQCDSGCLMMMSDELNWAKICFEFMNKIPTIVTVVTRTNSDDCNSNEVAITAPYLRLARFGNCFAFHYSEDGDNWRLVRYFSMEVPNELKVGLVAQSPFGSGCTVTFHSFETHENFNDEVKTVK